MVARILSISRQIRGCLILQKEQQDRWWKIRFPRHVFSSIRIKTIIVTLTYIYILDYMLTIFIQGMLYNLFIYFCIAGNSFTYILVSYIIYILYGHWIPIQNIVKICINIYICFVYLYTILVIRKITYCLLL